MKTFKETLKLFIASYDRIIQMRKTLETFKTDLYKLQMNNIKEIINRIEFFIDFDDARNYFKSHYGNVKKLR